jgi:putative membrane protein (TIGR04086 family)
MSDGPNAGKGVRLRIDWEVVVRSAALAVAVAVPTIVLGATVARDSNVIVLLYFVLLAGQVWAGFYAGRHRLDAPLIHGALASLTSFAVLVVVVIAARAVAGKSGPDPFNLVFHAFMSCSTGIFGALLASRSTKPVAPPSAPTDPSDAA